MTFRVGQKVVCIKEPIPQADCKYAIFEKGALYTVTLIEECSLGTFITVAELHPNVTGEACGFRPVVERKTDISVFTKMLTGKKVNANAQA